MKPNKRDNLKYIFSPRSIAVIGATSRPGSIGKSLFSNILFSGYTGIVYPVNPKARGVLGVRAYRTVWDIPESVDLAVIIVPSQHVPGALEECGEKEIKSAIIITAGFREIGEKGAGLQKSIIDISNKYGISLIGPNCLGVINTDAAVSLNATFISQMLKPGNIAFVSQSGGLGVAALEYARNNNVGLSKFISIGNKADVTENELLELLMHDPLTDVILLYIEDLTNPKGFIELARTITDNQTKSKPILAIKSGRTVEGARAASSHTGALGSSDEAYNSLFAQCGVLRVESIEELFNYAMAFAHQPLPKGNRIGIVTNAGGFGIMATDEAIHQGLRLSEFENKTKECLAGNLSTSATIHNPVDILGDAKPEQYSFALECVLNDKNVDGAIVITTPPPMIDLKEVTTEISNVIVKHTKPVLVCSLGVTDISESLKILDDKNIPHYRFPEAASKSMARLVEYEQWINRVRTDVKIFDDVDKKTVRDMIALARKEKRTFLPEPEAYAILKAYGFPVLDFRFAKNETECLAYAQEIGFPVVLKIVSLDIVHKFDVGGVKINIQSEEELRTSYHEMLQRVEKEAPGAVIRGILLQKMAGKGKETIIGMNRDPHFGPMLMFGLGGVYVEALKDVTFRMAPIRELSSYHMIEAIRSYPLLKGVRGEEPSDIDSLAECLMRLSQLAIDFEDIAELDVNPLLVFTKGNGAGVIDARILLGKK